MSLKFCRIQSVLHPWPLEQNTMHHILILDRVQLCRWRKQMRPTINNMSYRVDCIGYQIRITISYQVLKLLTMTRAWKWKWHLEMKWHQKAILFLFHKTFNKGEKIKMWKIMSSTGLRFHRDTWLMLCCLLHCTFLVLVFILLVKNDVGPFVLPPSWVSALFLV